MSLLGWILGWAAAHPVHPLDPPLGPAIIVRQKGRNLNSAKPKARFGGTFPNQKSTQNRRQSSQGTQILKPCSCSPTNRSTGIEAEQARRNLSAVVAVSARIHRSAENPGISCINFTLDRRGVSDTLRC